MEPRLTVPDLHLGSPLVCAYAAFQDWDGVFAFAYNRRANDWNRQSIAGLFEGADFSSARRILITATGAAENTGMKWRDAGRTSVDTDWGTAPSLVEGITATVKLPGASRFKAWALDERGQRRDPVSMSDGTLRLDPKYRTLWYEVAVE